MCLWCEGPYLNRVCAFGERGLIRGCAFSERGLIRVCAFGERGLIRGCAFGERGLLRRGLLYNIMLQQKNICFDVFT